MVRSVVFGADRTGKLQRPWLGANIQSVTQKIAQTIGLDRPAGTLITELHHLGPAIRSGLVVGDVVTRIDGHKVYDTESLLFRIATSRVGEIAKLSVVRGKDILTLPLLLESPPEIPPRQETLLKGQQPVSGVTVVNLSPAVAEERGLNQFATGVIIIEVESRSPAARIGFRSGDIILQINSTRIVSVPDLVKSTRSIPKTWHLVINRKGQRLTMTVSG
jgi:serine protease Do